MKEEATGLGFETPKLRRGLFGYRRESITRLLAERNEFYMKSEDRAREADARIADLERQLQAARSRSAGQPGPAQAPDQPPAEAPQWEERHPTNRSSEPSAAPIISEEIARVLGAAQEAATRIMERSQAVAEQRLQEAERLWQRVQAEAARMASWREQIGPAIDAANSRLSQVRAEAKETPERIRRALGPLADAIETLDGELAGLESATNPPLLLAPQPLDEDPEESRAGDVPDEYVPPSLGIA